MPGPIESPLIPVTLLTGFLGSGKTTVLNRLLRDPAAERMAVIVNEFGEIGLDHVLIERKSSDTVLLTNGCVCCTVRNDLGVTLEQLLLQKTRAEIPSFKRVVIETTGLADPAPIVHMLMTGTLIASSYRLGGIIATADAVNGVATFDRHVEAVKQVAMADRIILTKTDIADEPQVLRLRRSLSALNPGAIPIVAVNGAMDPADVLDVGLYNPRTKTLDVRHWLRAEAYPDSQQAHRHHSTHCDSGHENDSLAELPGTHTHGIESYSVTLDEPVPWKAFLRWLDAITLQRGEDLLRVKGIVNIAEQPETPVVVHGVQQIFHPPVALNQWPGTDRRTRLVFITRNIDRGTIEGTLRAFLTH